MLFKDLSGNTYDTNSIRGSIETVELSNNPPHWGWWILWLLLFWPALFILFFMCFRPAYVICFYHKENSYQVKVDSDTYNILSVKGVVA